MSLTSTASQVAQEPSLPRSAVAAALTLFDEGNTLPFVARYRKERTGGLDEVQLRKIMERARYVAELEDRRRTILESIEEQDAMTDTLRRSIEAAATQQELEDLYLPFRPRRRTRATMARERGLEPLAELIGDGRVDDAGAAREARWFVDPELEVVDTEAALQGARDILAEEIAEDVALRRWIRERMRKRGVVTARARRGKKGVTVRVLTVELERGRIGLSMKQEREAGSG